MTRPLRLSAALLIAGLQAIPSVQACAPDGPTLTFTWARHPDLPLNGFAGGHLGILQPSYARSYLVVAYRYLSGMPLTRCERQSALELWDLRLEGGVRLPPARPDPAPARPTWTEARQRATREPAPQPSQILWNESFYRPYITDSALVVAAATLQDRARRWQPELTLEWIRAQDQVFATNGKAGSALAPLPGRDPLFQKDRAYQMACARLYSGDFAGARAAFGALALDAKSPWQRLSAYLTGRCWLLEADRLPPQESARALACYQEAHRVFKGLQQGGLPARPASPAPEGLPESELLEAIQAGEQRTLALCEPLAAERLMAAELRSPGASQDFGDLLGRFSNLLDANTKGESDFSEDPRKPRTILPGLLQDDLAEWVFRFQESGPEAYALALSRWQERKSLPWLLMALSLGEPQAQGVAELLRAAAQLSAQQPGFESFAFHRARILAAQGHARAAKAIIAPFLRADPKPASPSARNLWRALRMPLAEDARAFLADALRVPAGFCGLYWEHDGRADSLATGYAGFQATQPLMRKLLKGTQAPARFLEADGARILNLQAPTEVLLALAANPEVPPHLAREWTRAAWVRAVLLERWELAAQATPALLRQEPELQASMEGFAGATPEQRPRQALLTLLRHPGLRWMVFQGINNRTFTEPGEKPLPLRQRDTFLGACWWPASSGETSTSDVMSNWYGWEGSFYYPTPHALERPLQTLVGSGPRPVPWLSAEQQTRGRQESLRLGALAEAPDWLAAQALAWAQAAPLDPRVPEALHCAVRAGKVGGSKPFGALCFRLLHSRYPRSSWAQATPIHY